MSYAKITKWSRWSVITLSLISVFLGSTIRVIEYAVDPHAVRQIFPLVGEELLYTIPIILWVSAAFSLFLYWVELHLNTGIEEIQFVKRLRPILYVLICANIVIVFPAAVVKAIYNTFATVVLYQVTFAFFFATFILISLVFGTRLRRHLKDIYVNTKISAYKDFLVKMTIFIYVMSFFFAAAAITLIVFLIAGTSNRWNYVIIHFFIRVEEFGLLVTSLYFFHKKAPKRRFGTSSGSATGSIRSAYDRNSVNLSVERVESFETIKTEGD